MPNRFCSRCNVEKQIEYVTSINDAGLKTTDVRARILAPSEIQHVDRVLKRDERRKAEFRASGVSFGDL